jgi:ADP-heptose:LPS heptosyltransferase
VIRTQSAAECAALGRALLGRREPAAALPHFYEALRGGECPRTHVNERWTCWMLLGQFERAWQESDVVGASFDREVMGRAKSVSIRCLRGFGDAIQFLRYIPGLAAPARSVIVHAPRPMHALLRRLEGIERVVTLEEKSSCDGDMECSDLPYFFRTTLDDIPPAANFSLPRAECNVEAQYRNIGIVWAAGEWNPARSLPVESFRSLAEIPGITLHSLQRLPHLLSTTPSSAPRLPDFLHNLEGETQSILATAESILSLDLIVSVDTMVAHLAASLGKPVWLLLPWRGDWRWMLARGDSPWYPGMRILRQPRDGDWRPVIERVRAMLLECVRTHALAE